MILPANTYIVHQPRGCGIAASAQCSRLALLSFLDDPLISATMQLRPEVMRVRSPVDSPYQHLKSIRICGSPGAGMKAPGPKIDSLGGGWSLCEHTPSNPVLSFQDSHLCTLILCKRRLTLSHVAFCKVQHMQATWLAFERITVWQPSEYQCLRETKSFFCDGPTWLCPTLYPVRALQAAIHSMQHFPDVMRCCGKAMDRLAIVAGQLHCLQQCGVGQSSSSSGSS